MCAIEGVGRQTCHHILQYLWDHFKLPAGGQSFTLRRELHISCQRQDCHVVTMLQQIEPCLLSCCAYSV